MSHREGYTEPIAREYEPNTPLMRMLHCFDSLTDMSGRWHSLFGLLCSFKPFKKKQKNTGENVRIVQKRKLSLKMLCSKVSILYGRLVNVEAVMYHHDDTDLRQCSADAVYRFITAPEWCIPRFLSLTLKRKNSLTVIWTKYFNWYGRRSGDKSVFSSFWKLQVDMFSIFC